MAFVAATLYESPEVLITNAGSVGEHYLRVMDSGLSGYVMREVGVYPDEAHERLAGILSGVVEFPPRGDRYNFPLDGPQGRYDLPLHIDTPRVPFAAQVVETTVWVGEIEVDIFSLREPYASVRYDRRYDDGIKHALSRYDTGGTVDDTRIDPIGHRCLLTRGDMFIFSDSQNPHRFRTLKKPRESVGTLYHPRRVGS